MRSTKGNLTAITLAIQPCSVQEVNGNLRRVERYASFLLKLFRIQKPSRGAQSTRI